MKEFRVVARLYNNRLRERREMTGKSACAFAESIGVAPTTYCAYESLKESPIYKRRAAQTWKPVALRIAVAFGVDPKELWPDAALAIRQSKVERRMDAEEMAAALSPANASTPFGMLAAAEEKAAIIEAVAEAVAVLNPREQRLLEMRYGLDGSNGCSLDDVAVAFGVSRGRARQIEQKGLRKLRHPFVSSKLKEFVES